MRADTAKIEERDISNIHTIKNKPQGKKNKPFFKINLCYRCGELHLFKDCLFKHKNTILAGAKTQILTLQTWRGELFKKKKKWVQFTTEQATTEKVQRKYINICLNNKKNKIADRHWV